MFLIHILMYNMRLTNIRLYIEKFRGKINVQTMCVNVCWYDLVGFKTIYTP